MRCLNSLHGVVILFPSEDESGISEEQAFPEAIGGESRGTTKRKTAEAAPRSAELLQVYRNGNPAQTTSP